VIIPRTRATSRAALRRLTGVYDPTLIDAGFFYPILDSNNNFTGTCITSSGDLVPIN
jgi:hypothetical protein